MNRTMRAAFVIARRDFVALVFSKSFFFFLIGPLVMIGVAFAAGGLSRQATQHDGPPVVGAMMTRNDVTRLLAARARLAQVADGLPELAPVAQGSTPATLLASGRGGMDYQAILTGSLDQPVLYATQAGNQAWRAKLQFLLSEARQQDPFQRIAIETRIVPAAIAPGARDRLPTAMAGQTILFVLTMLLAGMVLSTLVEEKANKIIEVLAASIPIEAIFLGKLFAMLAMAWLAIGVWASAGGLLLALAGSAMPVLPPPAMGWSAFLLLAILYFSMAYVLLGSLFLAIGGLAATVRDVQTLSLPVTLGHLGIFLFATYSLSHLGQPIEIAAAILPFSSPYVMLARAAQQAALWPQLLALVWQGLWAWLIVRAGASLFCRNVLKSGGGSGRSRRPSRLRWRRS